MSAEDKTVLHPVPGVLIDPDKGDEQVTVSERETVFIEVWKRQQNSGFSLLTIMPASDLTNLEDVLRFGAGIYKLVGKCVNNRVTKVRAPVLVGDFAPEGARPTVEPSPASMRRVTEGNNEAISKIIAFATGTIVPMVTTWFKDSREREERERREARERDERNRTEATSARDEMMKAVMRLAEARNSDLAQLLESALKSKGSGGGGGLPAGAMTAEQVADVMDLKTTLVAEHIEAIREASKNDDSKLLESIIVGIFEGSKGKKPDDAPTEGKANGVAS